MRLLRRRTRCCRAAGLRDVLIDVDAAGIIARAEPNRAPGDARTRWRPGDPRDAESALACVPAGARRPHRARGRRRRQLLDVAAGDVRVSRSRRRRCVRGDRRAGVRRDAEGGLHGGRRVPLRPSRSRRQAVRGSGGAVAPHRRRAPRRGDRAHAAAGVLRARGIRRRAGDRGTAALRAYASIRLRASTQRSRADAARARVHARRRAAQPARRRRRTSLPRSSRCAAPRAPIHIHAAEQVREVDRVRRVERIAPRRMAARSRRASMRAGASSTRRT